MIRKAFAAAVCMVLGVLAAPYLGLEHYPTVICLFVLALAIKLVMSRKTNWFPAFLAFLFLFMCGYASVKDSIAQTSIYLYGGEPHEIKGVVVSIPEQKGDRQRCEFLVGSVDGQDASFKTILTLEDGKVRYGTVLTLYAGLRSPSAAANPGEFDYQEYLKSSNIVATLYAKEATVTGEEKKNPVMKAADALHARIVTIIDSAFTGEHRALLKGILLGDKSGFTKELKAVFSKSGLSHIVAVSGTHVSIILAILLFLLRPFGYRNRYLTPLYLAGIAFFVLLTGCQPSAVRAGIMCGLFLLSALFLRNADGISSLSVAVMIMLAWNPFVLYNVGFQLSTLATLGILLFGPFLSEKLDRFLPKGVSSILSVTLAAQILIVPVTIHTFQQAVFLGLLANLVVLPILPVLMGFGIASVAVLSISHVAAAPLVFGTNLLLTFVIGTAKFFASLPLSAIKIYVFGFFACAGYVCLVLALLAKCRQRHWLPYMGAAALLFLASFASNAYSHSFFTLHFINVGQGDCSLLRQGKTAVLIDAGQQQRGETDYDLAEEIVYPYLRSQGIRRLSAVFVSHYHDDHMNAVVSLVEQGVVAQLFLPDTDEGDPNRQALTDAAAKSKTPVSFLRAGAVVTAGPMRFTVLLPDGEAQSEADMNEHSMVVRTEYGETKMLFTGDIGFESEKKLLSRDIQCDILKVAHHGSKYASGEAFLNAVQPLYCVISSGTASSSHPSPEALKRLGRQGRKVYVTEYNGTVTFRLDRQGGIHPNTFWQNDTID